MHAALRRLPLLGIVIVATGCDNVEWGGVKLGLMVPSDSGVSDPSAEVVEVVEDAVESTLSGGFHEGNVVACQVTPGEHTGTIRHVI